MNNETILKLINNYNVNRITFINDLTNTKFINQFVNHIYIINLDTDILRRNYIIKIMEKYNINFELVIVQKLQQNQYEFIKHNFRKIGEAGCYLSHMYCLNDAITNNFDNILIFEDDIILHKDFHRIFEKNITENKLDMFLLGASDFSFKKLNLINLDETKLIYCPDIKTKFLCGMYAIFYSKLGYEQVFKTRLNEPTYMDDNLIQFLEIFRDTFYISYPSLVAVDVSNTNIDHDFWVINLLRDKYYYTNCFNSNFEFSNYNFINLQLLVDCIVDPTLSYKDNILGIVTKFFQNDIEKINIINKRLEYIFFTTDDLNFIINRP